MSAVDGDQERVAAPGCIVAVLETAAQEDAILDRQRGEIAGADADDGHPRRPRLDLCHGEATLLPVHSASVSSDAKKEGLSDPGPLTIPKTSPVVPGTSR